MMRWLNSLVSEEDLAKYLYCSAIFEEEVAKAYQKISEKVSDKAVSYLLEYIAKDSFKHAVAFKALATHLTQQIEYVDCEKILGEAWVKTVGEAKRYAAREDEVTLSEVKTIIKEFEGYEGYAAEEYLTILYTEVLKLLTEKQHIDLQEYKTILEWIVEDEKRHIQILTFIKSRIARRDEGS
jgi:rubrerythrin